MNEQNIQNQIVEAVSAEQTLEETLEEKKQLKDHFFFQALSIVFKDPFYVVLALSSALNVLFFYYFIFLKVTTFSVFFQSNVALYNWLSIISTLLISALFGLAISFLIWQWQNQKNINAAHTGNGLIGSFLGALSVGCPACGAMLFSLFGVAGGLFIFPFQGLEIKVAALILLGLSVLYSGKAIADHAQGVCKQESGEKIIKFEDKRLVVSLNKTTLEPFLPVFAGLFLILFVLLAPTISAKMGLGVKFQKQAIVNSGNNNSSDSETNDVMKQINPPEGYTLNVVYGNIGPKLLESGAINLEAMKELYKQAGASLTDEQLKMLAQGSNEQIKITPQNSYFLLNFFWAFGLANKNPILEQGPMMTYGKGQIGNFASTGGWTLGTKKATELYSKYEIVKLTQDQQKVLEDFAFNSYRPCCSNPTGFPDCNHGMAALGLAELMASQGATAEQIFEAFKYFNSFWFPQTYFDIANYFKAKEGLSWNQVNARTVAGKDYSTPQGWDKVRTWLKSNNLLQEPPSGGGGCGV